MTDVHACPLCNANNSHLFWQDKRREYWQCHQCHLVFVPNAFHLSAVQEKAEYDKHENSVTDEGYLRFLSRVTTPLLQKLCGNQVGLDYGSGPAPALAEVMKSHHHSMDVYDLYYYPNDEIFNRQYDFITCTEVIEHLANPQRELSIFHRLLKTNGLLAIMTKRLIDREAFSTWHYKNDPTHIGFYPDQTFCWIAQKWGYQLDFIDKDVVFLSKLSIKE